MVRRSLALLRSFPFADVARTPKAQLWPSAQRVRKKIDSRLRTLREFRIVDQRQDVRDESGHKAISVQAAVLLEGCCDFLRRLGLQQWDFQSCPHLAELNPEIVGMPCDPIQWHFPGPPARLGLIVGIALLK